MTEHPPDGRAGIDAALVQRLVAAQLPQWRGLPVTPVVDDGWDNRTFRLGDELTVRLPTAEWYAAAVAKEDEWLPVLAPLLPVTIPTPVATGAPGEGYPYPWSVRRWLPGRTALQRPPRDLVALAEDVAGFLLALQSVDPDAGPVAGAHSFHRGAPPAHYDHEVRRCLAVLDGRIDTRAAAVVWQAALDSAWTAPPVWFHGDVAAGNLLLADSRLSAVIDFGTCGVGDPACDLVIAWTLFQGESRECFRACAGQDEGTWARARGWALWKSLLGLAGDGQDDATTSTNRRIVADVVAEHGAR